MKTKIIILLLAMFCFIGAAVASEREYALEIVSLHHEYSDSIMFMVQDMVEYRENGKEFCDSIDERIRGEFYLMYNNERVYCGKVKEHFIQRYRYIANIAYKLSDYCQFYMGFGVEERHCITKALFDVSISYGTGSKNGTGVSEEMEEILTGA